MSEGNGNEGCRSSSRPYSTALPTRDYLTEMTRAAQRLSDSQFFFSEQRLSQLFDIDAWAEDEPEESVDDLRDGENDREPPPEPAPRSSYCPPSPDRSGQAASVNDFSSHIFSPPSHADEQRFSADVAMHMSRLSGISAGSARFSTSHDGDEDDEDAYGVEIAGSDVTPTPDSPTSCHPTANSSRMSILSQLTDIASSRCSYATSSLPSVLSDLAGEMGGVADLLTDDDDGPGPPLVWGDEQVNWQERCLELELSLQRFRDQAGKIRELLREKVSDFYFYLVIICIYLSI